MGFIRRIYGREDTDVYLTRIKLLPKIFGWRLMLHIFSRPDSDRHFHDHPFDFYTLPLWPLSGYTEYQVRDGKTRYIDVPAFWITKRFAEHRHIITWWRGLTKGRKAVTLVLHSPRRRKWGFWVPQPDVEEYDNGGRTMLTQLGLIDNTVHTFIPFNRYIDE